MSKPTTCSGSGSGGLLALAGGAGIGINQHTKVSTMKISTTLFASALLSILHPSSAYAPLAGVTARSVKTSEDVDLSDFISTPSSKGKKTMLVLATYAADFNAIEYAQRLRYYMPQLQERGITKIGMVLNCESDSAKALVDLVDLPCDSSEGYGVTLMVDPLGEAGRAFGVGTGWRPDDKEMSPYVKLFGMLWGLGVSILINGLQLQSLALAIANTRYDHLQHV